MRADQQIDALSRNANNAFPLAQPPLPNTTQRSVKNNKISSDAAKDILRFNHKFNEICQMANQSHAFNTLRHQVIEKRKIASSAMANANFAIKRNHKAQEQSAKIQQQITQQNQEIQKITAKKNTVTTHNTDNLHADALEKLIHRIEAQLNHKQQQISHLEQLNHKYKVASQAEQEKHETQKILCENAFRTYSSILRKIDKKLANEQDSFVDISQENQFNITHLVNDQLMDEGQKMTLSYFLNCDFSATNQEMIHKIQTNPQLLNMTPETFAGIVTGYIEPRDPLPDNPLDHTTVNEKAKHLTDKFLENAKSKIVTYREWLTHQAPNNIEQQAFTSSLEPSENASEITSSPKDSAFLATTEASSFELSEVTTATDKPSTEQLSTTEHSLAQQRQLGSPDASNSALSSTPEHKTPHLWQTSQSSQLDIFVEKQLELLQSYHQQPYQGLGRWFKVFCKKNPQQVQIEALIKTFNELFQAELNEHTKAEHIALAIYKIKASVDAPHFDSEFRHTLDEMQKSVIRLAPNQQAIEEIFQHYKTQ
jgi:hypothetical protein